MEKICQTCGGKDFSNSLIYCTECWDVVEHMYCLGVSPDDVRDDFSWVCDCCASTNQLLVEGVIFGENSPKMTKSVGLPTTMSERHLPASATCVVGPIWRGTFDILGIYYGSLDGLEAFMPRTSYLKIVEVVRLMKSSVCFHMKKRHDVNPKYFNELGARSRNIELYIFPGLSRLHEDDYDRLVAYMIDNDLAMTSDIGNLQLTVFTSLEQFHAKQQKVQGKYYLWGTFKRNKSRKFLPSKSNRNSSEKDRFSEGFRAVNCTNRSSNRAPNLCNEITDSKFNHGIKLHQTETLASSVLKRNHIASLVGNCKGYRSKRRRPSYSLYPGVDLGKGDKESREQVSNAQGAVTTPRMFKKPNQAGASSGIEHLARDYVQICFTNHEECAPQVTIETNKHKKLVDKGKNKIVGAEIAIVCNNMTDTSDKDVEERGCRANDMPQDHVSLEDPKRPVSFVMESAEAVENSLPLLANPKGEIILLHGGMSGVSLFSNIASSLPSLERKINEISTDKIVEQVCPYEGEPDLVPALEKVVDEHEVTHNSIFEEIVETDWPNHKTDDELGASLPTVQSGSTRLEKDSLYHFDTMVSACDGQVESEVIGLNESLVGNTSSIIPAIFLQPIPKEIRPEPFSILLPVQVLEWHRQQLQSSCGLQTTFPGNGACSIGEEISPFSDTRPAIDDHDNNVEDKVPKVNEELTKDGISQLAFREGQEESPTAKLSLEMLELPLQKSPTSPCSTPLLDFEEVCDHGNNIEDKVSIVVEESIQERQAPSTLLSTEALQPSPEKAITDPENDTCSTSVIDYSKSEEMEPTYATDEEINPCSNNESAGALLNSMIGDHVDKIGNKIPGVNEALTMDGVNLLASTHRENGTCVTLLLDVDEKSAECTSPSNATSKFTESYNECSRCETEDTEAVTDMTKIADKFLETCSSRTVSQVGRYKIKAHLAPILTRVLEKHGDIAQDCSIVPEFLLENICKALRDLESIRLRNLRRHHLDDLGNTLKLAEALKIDVKWLAKRFQELEDIAAGIVRYPDLKNKLNKCKKDVESIEEVLSVKRANVSKLQEEIKSLTVKLEPLKEMGEKLDCFKEDTKFACTRVLAKSSVDGII